MKELEPEIFFQCLDLMTDCRGCDMQFLRSSGKAPMPGSNLKDTKSIQGRESHRFGSYMAKFI